MSTTRISRGLVRAAGIAALLAGCVPPPSGSVDPGQLAAAPPAGSQPSRSPVQPVRYDVSVERPGALGPGAHARHESTDGEEWDYGLVTHGPDSPYVRVSTSYVVPLLEPHGWRFWGRAQDDTGRSLRTQAVRRSVACGESACRLTEVVHVRLREADLPAFQRGGKRLTLIAKSGEEKSLILGPGASEPLVLEAARSRIEPVEPEPTVVCREGGVILPRTPAECAAAGGNIEPLPALEPVPATIPSPEVPLARPLPEPVMPPPPYTPAPRFTPEPEAMVVCQEGGIVLPRTPGQCAAAGGSIVPPVESSVAPVPSLPYRDASAMTVCQEGGLVLPRTVEQCLARGGRIATD